MSYNVLCHRCCQPKAILPAMLYPSTLGRKEYETVAARIIAESQKAGSWTALKDVNDQIAGAMIKEGWLEEWADGYMLTPAAVEEILEKFPKSPTTVPGIHMLFRRGNEYLLHQRLNTGFMDDHWSVPGGHIDAYESPAETIVREAREETGVIIQPEDIEFANVIYRIKKPDAEVRTDLCFLIRKWEGTPSNKEPKKHGPFEWFPVNDLPTPMVPYIAQAIADIEAGKSFTETRC